MGEDNQSEIDPLASIGQKEDFTDGPDAKEIENFETLQRFRIDPSEELEPPTIALRIQGCPVASLGNFSLLIGKAKSKKSFATILAAAAVLNSGKEEKNAITGSAEDDTMTGHLPPDRSGVLAIDTEQAKYSVDKNQKRTMALAGHAEGLWTYGIRELNTSKRCDAVETYIAGLSGECGFVIIDGIRDLVSDINDPDEATRISDLLLRLTTRYNVHIMAVLHQNKTDQNARGHLGTELLNKCETTLKVEKDEKDSEISVVSPEKTREEEFEPFAFSIDPRPKGSKYALPFIVEGWAARVNKSKRDKLDPEALAPQTHNLILGDLAGHVADGIGYTDLWRQLKRSVYKTLNESIGDNLAKDYVAHYQRQGVVQNESPQGSRASYSIKLE